MDKFERPKPLDAGLGAKLIEMALFPEFSDLLLQAARERGGVEEVFAFTLAEGKAPEVLVTASVNSGCDQRVEQYIKRFFFHDPLIQERQNIAVGAGFAYRVYVKEIAPYDYRALCFEKPQYDEKLCFGWKNEKQLLVLNFYRSQNQASASEDTGLDGLADLALAALQRRLSSSTLAEGVDIIGKRLQHYFPALTAREVQICQFSLAGKSAKDIAADLGISANSVLTYRQRAYGRVGVHSAQELMPYLVI
jgi:DNA-binding CsgD family transcriptional regulator